MGWWFQSKFKYKKRTAILLKKNSSCSGLECAEFGDKAFDKYVEELPKVETDIAPPDDTSVNKLTQNSDYLFFDAFKMALYGMLL